jgi:hypothetical protein
MPTYTLAYNTQLTEDYIHAESILASSTAASPLARFVNASGQSEALVIHDDGELCHLQREPLSNSGWNIVGVGAEVTTIATANSGSRPHARFDGKSTPARHFQRKKTPIR